MRRATAIIGMAALAACSSPSTERQAELACEKYWEAVQESAAGEMPRSALGPEFLTVQTRANASERADMIAGADALLAAVAADDDAALADAVAEFSQICTDAGF